MKIELNGQDFRTLVSGGVVKMAGGIEINLSDIGFAIMRQIITDVEEKQLRADEEKAHGHAIGM